jgi:predicted ATPase
MRWGTGLCGSHRTGKTTLAAEFAATHGIRLVKTTTSEVFAANNLDPAAKMDFATRLWIQHKIVAEALKVWQQEDSPFITDRTPIDMMAYTLGDIQGDTEVDFTELKKYLDYCFKVTNEVFSRLVILQPAIPLVQEEGKARLNRGYIEHLNLLILGLGNDERLRCPVHIIPRNVLDLTQRVQDVSRV